MEDEGVIPMDVDSTHNNTTTTTEPGESEAGAASIAKTKEDPMTNQERLVFQDEMKFMKDFDPNQRNIKKKMTKFTEDGIILEKCDCLIPTCPGCHFPCETCSSRLCGHECRLERRWEYEEIQIQGYSNTFTRKSKN